MVEAVAENGTHLNENNMNGAAAAAAGRTALLCCPPRYWESLLVRETDFTRDQAPEYNLSEGHANKLSADFWQPRRNSFVNETSSHE